jgi:hypothetical protein
MDTKQMPTGTRTRFWPTSGAGRWSVGAISTFALGLAGLLIAAALGQKGGETFSDNWWLAGPGAVAAVSAIAAFGCSIRALALRDRAVSVIIALVLSSFAIFFMLGEVLFPH